MNYLKKIREANLKQRQQATQYLQAAEVDLNDLPRIPYQPPKRQVVAVVPQPY
jgi:hypothetical protein